MSQLVGLDDVKAAAERIASRIRHTPVIPVASAEALPLLPPDRNLDLWLKLESLQVTGSFKARGALNKLAMLDEAALAAGVVTASGGNHGLALAHAAHVFGTAATVYLPQGTDPVKMRGIRRWGATVIEEGQVWDDANAAALAAAREQGLTYVHPFADPAVIAGQGTLALEVLAQVPGAVTLLVAVGGGGLISGVALAARAIKPGIRIVGIEPTGAPTLFESLKAGRLVTLDRISTAAGTLAPRRSMAINLSLVRDNVDRIVLVTDAEMRVAARWLWTEFGVGAELSGAAAVAALLSGRHAPAADETVVAIVCGAGADGIE